MCVLTETSTLIVKVRRPLVMLMLIALLLAQSALVVHALSHAREGAGDAAAAGHHLQFCPNCAAFAGLQAGAGAVTLPPLPLDSTTDALIPTELRLGTTLHTLQAYRSRAPPG